jgi:hypothetical protein
MIQHGNCYGQLIAVRPDFTAAEQRLGASADGLAAQTSGGAGCPGQFCDPRLSGIAPRRNYILRSQFYLIVGQVATMRLAAFNQKTTPELQAMSMVSPDLM